MATIPAHLPTALRDHDIRRACTAVEAILRAADILDELPPAALEQIKDYCLDYNQDRKDSFSEFKRAYIKMVCEHLNDARLRERTLYTGLTGESAA